MESCREAISECHGATVTFNLIVYPSTLKHLTVTLYSNAHTCSDIDVFRKRSQPNYPSTMHFL